MGFGHWQGEIPLTKANARRAAKGYADRLLGGPAGGSVFVSSMAQSSLSPDSHKPMNINAMATLANLLLAKQQLLTTGHARRWRM